MRILNKSVLILLSALIALASGCGDGGSIFSTRSDLISLQVIQSLGLDIGEDGGFIVTVVSSQGAEGAPPSVISHGGNSIQEALEKIQEYSSKEKLFYPHIGKILIGHEAARNGIHEILDFFERVPRVKLSTDIFIIKNSSAKDLVTEAASMPEIDLYAVLNSVKRDAESWGKGWVYTEVEITKSLAETGSALACAVERAEVEDIIFSEHPSVTAIPAGYAILRDGKLAGYISAQQARGANFIKGKVSGGSMTLETPEGVRATLELISDSAKLSPVWSENGQLKAVRADISVRAGISSLSGNVTLNGSFLNSLQELLETEIASLVLDVLETSQELNADFFGLKAELERNDPGRFRQMPLSFESVFSSLNFEPNVVANIDRSYDMWSPAKLSGGED